MQKSIKYAMTIPILAAILISTTAGLASQQQATGDSRVVVVHIASGKNNIHAAQMGVEHATSFLNAGKSVTILLDVDGVQIATQRPSADVKAVNQMLQDYLDAGGRVDACSHCIAMNNLQPSDMLPGVEIDHHPDMPRLNKLIDDGAIVLDY